MMELVVSGKIYCMSLFRAGGEYLFLIRRLHKVPLRKRVCLEPEAVGAPVSILVEVGRRGVSGGPNPPFSVPRAYMRRTRHRSLILSILINYTYRNAHIDFGARRSKKGVSGGTQPPFSVPRANMQRT